MINLQEILKSKIIAFETDPKKSLEVQGKDYSKRWAFAVQCFQKEINKDRKKDGKAPVNFISVRMKLAAIKEIDDLRWFFRECKKYAATKDEEGIKNTFSKCFYGALKLK